MLKTEIDHVVVWYDPDADADNYLATLAFDIPIGAENLETNGLTRLLLVSAMHAAGASPLPSKTAALAPDLMDSYVINGGQVEPTLGDGDLFVDVSGTGDSVASFLSRLCAALADPPMHLLGEFAEAAGTELSAPESALLAVRYGRSGPGVAYLSHPVSFDPAEVRAHAGRVFAAGNAVLVLQAPPPASLRLPLPAGPRLVVRVPESPYPGHPTWAALWGAESGMIVRATDSLEALVAMTVLTERLKRYGAVTLSGAVTYEQSTDWLVIVTAKRGKAGETVAGIWADVNELAATGPTEYEIRWSADQLRADLEPLLGQQDDVATAIGLALAEHFGRVPGVTSDMHAAIADLTPADARAVFAQALPTARFTAPFGERVEIEGFTELGGSHATYIPEGRVIVEKRFGFKRSNGIRLVLAPDSISRVDASDRVVTVRRSDAALVDRSDGRRVILGSDLATVVIDPDRFADADAAVRTIDSWF